MTNEEGMSKIRDYGSVDAVASNLGCSPQTVSLSSRMRTLA